MKKQLNKSTQINQNEPLVKNGQRLLVLEHQMTSLHEKIDYLLLKLDSLENKNVVWEK